MQLCQKIILTKSLELRTALVPVDEPGDGTQSFQLSFHPFLLKAVSEISLFNNCKPLHHNLHILISDNENKNPLFESLSQTRSLLLIAEIIHGLTEALETFGFNLRAIEPHNTMLVITFSSLERPKKTLIAALTLLKTSIESLLYVRGLKLEHAQLEIPNADQEIKHIMHHIFCERSSAPL